MNKNKILVVTTSFLLAMLVLFQNTMEVSAAFAGEIFSTPYLDLVDSEVVYRSIRPFTSDTTLISNQAYRIRLSFSFASNPGINVSYVTAWSDFYLEYGGVLYYPYVESDGYSGTVSFDIVSYGANSNNFSLYVDSHYLVDSNVIEMNSGSSGLTCRFTYELGSATEFSINPVFTTADNVIGQINDSANDIVSAIDGLNNGYIPPDGGGSNGGLDDSLGGLEDAEGGITGGAIDDLDNFTIDGEGISGYAEALLTVFPLVSAMMQSIFVSSGNLAIIITAGFTLTIVCILLGVAKFHMR